MIQWKERRYQHWYCCILSLSCMLSSMLFPSRGAAEPLLRVMTYNIAGSIVPEQAPIALVQRQKPDILLAQEVSNHGHFTRLKQHIGLPYGHFASYRRRAGGVAILSRWPLGGARILPWQGSPQGKLALAAPVAAPGGAFWVCSVHLDNPLWQRGQLNNWQKITLLWRELFATTRRSQEARALRAWFVDLGGDNSIIGGDFNSLPLAEADRHLRQYFDDALSIHFTEYWSGTYWGPPQHPIMPRIDFLYHAPQWRVIDARVVQQKASDHFPVFALFARQVTIREEARQRQHTKTGRAPATPLFSTADTAEAQ